MTVNLSSWFKAIKFKMTNFISEQRIVRLEFLVENWTNCSEGCWKFRPPPPKTRGAIKNDCRSVPWRTPFFDFEKNTGHLVLKALSSCLQTDKDIPCL